LVIAGLDPAIHLLAKRMDARVKPAHDEESGWRRRMPDLITVHDPRGYPPKVTGKRLAPRFSSLDGKIVYLVDCLFDNSAVFMEQLQQWFSAHLPAVVTRIIRPIESWVDDAAMRAQVASEGNAAILGVGL
jgi:hypothetical protein